MVTHYYSSEYLKPMLSSAAAFVAPGTSGRCSPLGIPLLMSVQVTIAGFLRSSPTSGSVLTAWSLLGTLSLSLSLSAPPPSLFFFSLSQNKQINIKKKVWGHWVAQSGKHPTLALIVRKFEPHIGLCADSMEPAWNPLSPSLSAPPLLMLSLFLKINK